MNQKIAYGNITQDIGLLAFLISVFCCFAVAFSGGGELLPESLFNLFLMAVAIVLVTFSSDFAAFIVAGSQLVCFTAYKLFNLYANGVPIQAVSYAWLVLPLAAVASMKLFCVGRQRLHFENEVLKKQVEGLVMIDPLTGLYNLRSFYHDIGRHISYVKRNGLPVTLMIIRLRYWEELSKILTKNQSDLLKQRLVRIVTDTIRVEDRIYSIDSEGGLALILTSSEEGAGLVRNRIRAKVSEKDAFDNIADTSVKVDVQIAFLQYKEEMGKDMMGYKSSVEKELQYDV